MKSERSFWWLVVTVFILLTGIAYFPVFYGKVPFPRDMVLQFAAWRGLARTEAWQTYADIGDLITAFYPARAFAARAVQSGVVPLWNPDFLSGAPFLASPQSSLFYPANVLYYVLSVPTAWSLSIMLQMFLSGLFMTLFARQIGASKSGSIFSAIVFALCGFMTAWKGQPMVDGATWLPLICYSVLRLERDSSYRSIALAAVGFAMPVLAGHPESAAHVTLTGTALALAAWTTLRFDFRFMKRFMIVAIFALGLASIQMIPTLQWIAQMPSALDMSWPVLQPKQILGWISRDVIRGPNSAGVWIPEAAAYAGMITLLLAPIGLLHRARRHVLFLVFATLISAGIAYGVAPLHWLVAHTPVLAGLKNGRMILIADFGVAALSGLGLTTLEQNLPAETRRRLLAIAITAAAFALTLVLVYKLQVITEFRVEVLRRPSFSRALLLAGVVPVVWRLYGGLSNGLFSVIACALVAFDLLSFAYGYLGFAGRDEIFPPAPVFDFLEKNTDRSRFRVATVGLPYSANANIMYRVPSADGYEVRLTLRHRMFSLDYTENRLDGIYLTASRLLKFTDRRLDMLNVKYLVAEARSPENEQLASSPRFTSAYHNGYIRVFENKSVLPRAFAVPINGIETIEDVEKQLDRLRSPEFDPEKSVVVSELPSSAKPNRRYSPIISKTVDVVDSSINYVTVRAALPDNAVLVLSQTYYPGWYATIDGSPTVVFPANVALTGIIVPAGTHEVRFLFRPLSFTIGAIVTILSILLLAVLARHTDQYTTSELPERIQSV